MYHTTIGVNMNTSEIVSLLRSMGNQRNVKFKQEKFGIYSHNSLGIYHADLKILAKDIGCNDKIAQELFNSGIYEARILCSKIHSPESINEKMMDEWVATFENWEICDSFCMGLFSRSQYAINKAIEWSAHESEFIKRAGFVIMASYGFKQKTVNNEIFNTFLAVIESAVNDDRVYVKKAVNWALRNIGKRNIDLHKNSISCAQRILRVESKSALWIAKNALKELNSPNVKMLDYPRKIYRPELG